MSDKLDPREITTVPALAVHVLYLREMVDKIDAQVTAQNGRVRTLEIWRAQQAGMASVMGAIAGLVGGVVSALVTAWLLGLLS